MRKVRESHDAFWDKYNNKREMNYKLIEEIAKSGDIDTAYEKIFPYIQPNKRALSLQSKLKTWSKLKDYFERLLNVQGLSIITANGKLRELMEAERPVVIKDEVRMFPDNQARLGAVQTLFKLHKVLGNDMNVVVDQHKELNITVEDAGKLSEIAVELAQLNDKMDLSKHKIKVIDAEVVDEGGGMPERKEGANV